MVSRRGAEIPHPRLAGAGQQTPARELVARPLADDRAREIADVVLIEHEDRAEARPRQRLTRAAQPIGVQAPEIHALFEVHLRVSRRLEGPVPSMARIDIVGGPGPGLRGGLLPGPAWPPLLPPPRPAGAQPPGGPRRPPQGGAFSPPF